MTLSAKHSKIFTLKVINPDKDKKSSLVFQSACSPARAVELVKEQNPEWKCIVIDSYDLQPWRRDERY